MDQFFCRVTRLDPPVTVDGLTCGLAIQFFSKPTNHTSRPFVVGGTVHAVTALSGGRKRIVCRRGAQQSSYTKVFGPGDSAEIVYDCVSGGNVAFTTEPERFLCFANEMACRGDDLHDRAVPGDVLEFEVASSPRRFLVVDADAYSVAPSIVNWASETPAPLVTYPNLDALTRLNGYDDGGEFFMPPADLLYQGCGVLWVSSTTTGFSDPKVFNKPGTSDPDPSWYPADAQFSSSVPEYWIDPSTYAVRLSTSHAAVSANSVQLRWFIRGLGVYTQEWWQPMVLDASSAAPSWDTEDQFVGAFNNTQGDFDRGATAESSFLVITGAGSLVWRRDLDPGAVGCRLDWDASGNFTYLGRREAADDVWISESLSTFSLTFPFRLRVVRSGTTFYFYSSDLALSSWTLRGSSTVAGLPNDSDGTIGIVDGGDGILFAGMTGATLLGQVLHTGRLSGMRIVSADFVASVAVTKASANAVTEVKNLTADATMAAGSTNRRSVYKVAGSTLVFPVECAGDIVRVTYAADPSPPSAPGRPPRTFDQINFATFSEANPEISTTNVNENVGNWHDALVVQDPDGELSDLTPGQSFSIYRDPVFDPRNPPDIEWDRRGDEGHDWAALSSSYYKTRWVEGLVLVSKDWVDANYDGRPLCFRVAGDRFVQRGGWSAEVHNELKHSIEIMDQVWTSPGSIGGESAGLSAYTSPMYVGPTGFSCCTPSGYEHWWKATDVAWGTSQRDFLGLAETYAPFPFWDAYIGMPYYSDSAKRTTAYNPETILACQGSDEQDSDLKHYRSNYDPTVPGEFAYWLFPFNKIGSGGFKGHWTRENRRITGYVGDYPIIEDDPAPAMDNYWGSGPDVGGCWAVTAVGARFGFGGVPFGIAEALKRLPDGTTIVEAKARVKFEGFRRVEWSGDYNFGPINRKVLVPPVPWFNWSYSENGHEIIRYAEVGGVVTDDFFDPLLPEPLKAGSVGFRLVAQRLNSKAIVLWNGTTWNAPSSTVHSLGAGLTVSEAADGEWRILNLTNVIQAVVDNRDNEFVNYQLWPSNNSLDPDDGTGAMAGYIRSLMPSPTASLNEDGCLWGWNSSASGAFNWYSSISFGSVFMRYRLPSGLVSEWVLPLYQPPHIPFGG